MIRESSFGKFLENILLCAFQSLLTFLIERYNLMVELKGLNFGRKMMVL